MHQTFDYESYMDLINIDATQLESSINSTIQVVY